MTTKPRQPARPPRAKSEVLTRSLPHERDVREGQVDTDNYTRMRDVGNAGLRKRR